MRYIALAEAFFIPELAERQPMLAPGPFTATAVSAQKRIPVSEVARILHDGLGAAGNRVPTRELPNFVVRLLGLFIPSVRPMVHDLGVFKSLSNETARSVLGWQPRSAEDALIEMGESLLQRGLINH